MQAEGALGTAWQFTADCLKPRVSLVQPTAGLLFLAQVLICQRKPQPIYDSGAGFGFRPETSFEQTHGFAKPIGSAIDRSLFGERPEFLFESHQLLGADCGR